MKVNGVASQQVTCGTCEGSGVRYGRGCSRCKGKGAFDEEHPLARRRREIHEVKKSFRFEAAHRLPHHGSKCARIHGHSYKMTIVLRGTRLARVGPSAGMLQDHSDVSKVVDPIVRDHLDHFYLNESTGLLEEHVAPHVASFDGIFVGGSLGWKMAWGGDGSRSRARPRARATWREGRSKKTKKREAQAFRSSLEGEDA